MLSCNKDFKGCKNHLYKLINFNSTFNLSDEILVLNQWAKGHSKQMRPKLNLSSLALDAHLSRLPRGHPDMSSHVLRVPLSLLKVEFILDITRATQGLYLLMLIISSWLEFILDSISESPTLLLENYNSLKLQVREVLIREQHKTTL